MINTDKNIEDLLKKFSIEDLEKLMMLFSIIPGNEQKEIVTLRVFRDEYLNLIKNNKSKSYYISVNLAFNHLLDFFGLQKSIQSFQLKDIENFLNHLQQKVKKGYVVYYRNLKAAFNKATEWNYIKENYFAKVKLPKQQKLAPVFVNSDQLSAISYKIKNRLVKDFITIAFYTGMRLDEIVNLRWKNVDLTNRVITVGDEEFCTKGRKQRFIPISDEVYIVLTNRRRIPSFVLSIGKGETFFNYIFCKENGEKFTGNYFSKYFKKACKAAGLDYSIHFHSLRHSFASNLVQKGVPLYTIKELLGHSSISTTEIYSHLNMETLREAIKKLDQTPSRLSDGQACVLPPSLRSGQALGKEEKPVVKIFKINSAEEG